MAPEIPAAVLDNRPTTPLVPLVGVYLAEVGTLMVAGINMAPETPAAVSEDRPTTRLVTPAEACRVVMKIATEVVATAMDLVVKRLARTLILEGPIMMTTTLRTLRAEVSRHILISPSSAERVSSLIFFNCADSMAGKLMEKAGGMFKSDKMERQGMEKREQAGYDGDNRDY